jgi:hypothetical protein
LIIPKLKINAGNGFFHESKPNYYLAEIEKKTSYRPYFMIQSPVMIHPILKRRIGEGIIF